MSEKTAFVWPISGLKPEEFVVNGLPVIRVNPTRLDVHSQVLLILPGGSVANGRRYASLPFMKELARLGHTVSSFDYQSNLAGNDHRKFGLDQRLRDAKLISDWAKKQADDLKLPFSLIGVSMGGFLAIKVANRAYINGLILLAPAAYADEACRSYVHFEGDFRRIIRSPMPDSNHLIARFWRWLLPSWRKSSIFRRAAEVDSDVILISYGRDEVVDRRIISRYREAFVSRRDSMFVFRSFKAFRHNGNTKDETKRGMIVSAIDDFLKETVQ